MVMVVSSALRLRDLIRYTDTDDVAAYKDLDFAQRQRVDFKPVGIWLSVGNAWGEFAADGLGKKYEHEIPVQLARGTRLVRVRDDLDVRNLTSEYGRRCRRPNPRQEDMALIDFAKVVADNPLASGIYFGPRAIAKGSQMWIGMMDVPSVCVWDGSKIVRV
jgi:hypothetical protein